MVVVGLLEEIEVAVVGLLEELEVVVVGLLEELEVAEVDQVEEDQDLEVGEVLEIGEEEDLEESVEEVPLDLVLVPQEGVVVEVQLDPAALSGHQEALEDQVIL